MSESDTSPDHFDWLAECRSRNQKTTVQLYRILKENPAALLRRPDLQLKAHGLTSIAFSLRRAVFLCDVSDDIERQTADMTTFLVSLIADNAVLYQTDKNARTGRFAIIWSMPNSG